MPFEYLSDIAGGDVAFRAWGSTFEEMIIAAGDATMGVMVGDPDTVVQREEREIEVEDGGEDLLLVQVLQELLFYKDAQSLLLRLSEGKVSRSQGVSRFTGKATGERIDSERHHLSTDVKAVTMHHLAVKRTERGWEGTVVLDV
ncbi:MAG: archease [Chitinivibrionales bacterium]|nr:archease [Chitinivibrionales bacterium]MBD3355794.1 archease [Chitinivibrionales bacterium]